MKGSGDARQWRPSGVVMEEVVSMGSGDKDKR
jgi:hypothetical protein